MVELRKYIKQLDRKMLPYYNGVFSFDGGKLVHYEFKEVCDDNEKLLQFDLHYLENVSELLDLCDSIYDNLYDDINNLIGEIYSIIYHNEPQFDSYLKEADRLVDEIASFDDYMYEILME